MTLDSIACGQAVTVIEVNLEDAVVKRLYAMGLRPNKSITIIRRATHRGPLHCRIGSTDILLRTNIAQAIVVAE